MSKVLLVRDNSSDSEEATRLQASSQKAPYFSGDEWLFY